MWSIIGIFFLIVGLIVLGIIIREIVSDRFEWECYRGGYGFGSGLGALIATIVLIVLGIVILLK